MKICSRLLFTFLSFALVFLGLFLPSTALADDGCGNLFYNSSFEQLGSWQYGTSGSYSTSNINLHNPINSIDGGYSASLLNETTGNNAYLYQDVNVIPGDTYYFSAYAFINNYVSGTGVFIDVKTTSFSTTYLTSANDTTNGQWVRLSGSFTAPASITTLRFILDSNYSNNLDLYWDAALLQQNPNLNAYCNSNINFIDIASPSAIATGIYQFTFIIWIGLWILCFTCGFFLGTWMYKR